MLHLDVHRMGEHVVLSASGALDVRSAPELRQRLLALHAAGDRRLVIDLDAVDVIDEMGLGVLLGGAWRARSSDGSFSLVCSSDRVRQILDVSGMDRAVDVHPTVTDAVSA